MELKKNEKFYLIIIFIFLIALYVFLFVKLIPMTQNKKINSILEIREVELKTHEEKTKNIVKDIDIFLSDNPVLKHI